jgi:hypothetical protein
MVTTYFDLSKIFLRENTSQQFTYDNTAGGTDVTIASGTVMGIVTSNGYTKPYNSTGTTGEQYPRYIAYGPTVIPAGTSAPVTVCVAGWVNGSQLVFSRNGDTLNTIVVQTDSGTQTTNLGTVRHEIQKNSGILIENIVDTSYND